jgi:hypothetical protein
VGLPLASRRGRATFYFVLMKKILCSIPVLAMLLALAGCCANDVCLCDDALADALSFEFKVGGTTGFPPSQIDTFFIVRITTPAANAPVGTMIVKDSVLRVLPLAISGSDTTIATGPNGTNLNSIVINNAAPFASAGSTTKLDAYTYRINAYQRVTRGGKRTISRVFFLINNIKLAGKDDPSGCCTCYENTLKVFDLSSNIHPLQPARTLPIVPDPNNPKALVTTLLTR